MLFANLVPPPDGLSPKEYRQYVKDCIRPHMNDALSVEDLVILYSGPSQIVWDAGLPDTKSNNKLSANMVRAILGRYKIKASRINNTEAGKALRKHNLNKYFTPYFEKNYPLADANELIRLQEAAYAEVWGGISELFAQRGFRHAATAVCGASQSRVFVKDELPVLVATDHLQTVNGIRFDAVRRLYNEVSKDEGLRLVCLSEINFIHSLPASNSRVANRIKRDTQRRVSYFELERANTEPLLDPLTDEQKQKRQAIISEFKLDALYTTAPRTWTASVKRPMRLSLLTSKPKGYTIK